MEEAAKCARSYGKAVAAVAAIVDAIEAEQAAALQARRDELRRRVRAAAAARERLVDVVRANPADFQKPRTRTVGGIRFGFRRRAAKTTPSDRTIALIKARLAPKASVLIRVKETVIQAALNALGDDELLEVEATRCPAHDVLVAQPEAGDVETRAALLLTDPRPSPGGPPAR